MRAIDWMGTLRAQLKRRSLRRAALKSGRRWRRHVPLAADIDALESRLSLSSSIASFYLASDTGIADDNVTADAFLGGTISNDGGSGVDVEIDLDGDGLADDFADVYSDGSFYFDANFYLPYGEVTVWARTVTWDVYKTGDVVYSDWVSLTFTYNMVPEITSFAAIAGSDNEWTFEGTVSDENVLALTIVFGGVLEGHQVLVNGDGTFSYTVTLAPDQEGVVTAQTTDEYGEDSEVAEDWVFAA